MAHPAPTERDTLIAWVRNAEGDGPVEAAQPGDLIRLTTQTQKAVWLEVCEVTGDGTLMTSSKGESLRLRVSGSQFDFRHAGPPLYDAVAFFCSTVPAFGSF